MTDKTKTTKKTTKATSASQPKIFDIAHPGQSLPSSSGKPIIVSHRSLVRDPMVNSDKEVEGTVANDQLATMLASTKKTRIEPLHDVDATEEPAAEAAEPVEEAAPELMPPAEALVAEKEEPTEEAAEQPAAAEMPKAEEETESETPPEEPEAEQEPEGETEAREDTDASDEEMAQLDAQAKERSKKEAEAEAEAKRQAELDTLVESKKYNLPINAVQKRRSMRAVLLLFIVVLAAVGFLAALDAGLINTGLTPPTDFIPN